MENAYLAEHKQIKIFEMSQCYMITAVKNASYHKWNKLTKDNLKG